MRHLTRSGVTLADLPDAEPVAVREVRLESPQGPVVVSYLLFRTRYGYHATAGDWRGMTVAERAWLLRHEELLNRALARDVEAVDADARSAAARGWIGAGSHLPGNGHVPAGAVGLSTGDPVGGGGGGMGDTDGSGREERGVEPTAGGGRDVPEAPGDMSEGAPVPKELGLIEAIVEADLSVASLAQAIAELEGHLNVRRPFRLMVHRYAVHLAQRTAWQLFGFSWGEHVHVVANELQFDEDEWALESERWRYHNVGA